MCVDVVDEMLESKSAFNLKRDMELYGESGRCCNELQEPTV